MESVAFADIVINLFVFFFITFGLFATFDPAQKGTFPIELPHANTSSSNKAFQPLALTIERNGTLHLGSQVIGRTELKEMLNHELLLRKDKKVLIRADRRISLQTLGSILDIVRSSKAKSISIETELP